MLILASAMILTFAASEGARETSMASITVTISGSVFAAKLYDNDAANAFKSKVSPCLCAIWQCAN